MHSIPQGGEDNMQIDWSIEGKESKKPHPNLPAADNTAVVGDSTAGPAAAVVVVQVLD